MNINDVGEQVRECFGKRLQKLREDAGLSQAELGRILGISRGSVSFYETSGRTADIAVLYAVAQYFNVSVEYLLGLDPHRSSFLPTEFLDTGTSSSSPEMVMRFGELFREMSRCFASYKEYFSNFGFNEIALETVRECLFAAVAAPIESYTSAVQSLQDGFSMSKVIGELSEKPNNSQLKLASMIAALQEGGKLNGNSDQEGR